MLIQWNDSCKIGIPGVDAEHKVLVDLVNNFFARSAEGAEPAELAAILHHLMEETKAHFRREEIILDRSSYPELLAHTAEHQSLILQMGHFLGCYEAGTASRELALENAEFLRNWLLGHISQGDRSYKPYVMTLA